MSATGLSGIEILALRLPHFFSAEGEVGKYTYDVLGMAPGDHKFEVIKSYTNLVALSLCSKAMVDIRFWKKWNFEVVDRDWLIKDKIAMEVSHYSFLQPFYRVVRCHGTSPDPQYLFNMDAEPAHVPKPSLREIEVDYRHFRPRGSNFALPATLITIGKRREGYGNSSEERVICKLFCERAYPRNERQELGRFFDYMFKNAIAGAYRLRRGGPGVVSAYRMRDCCEKHTFEHARRMTHSPHTRHAIAHLSAESMEALKVKCSPVLFAAIAECAAKTKYPNSISICGSAILDVLYKRDLDKPAATLDLFVKPTARNHFLEFMTSMEYHAKKEKKKKERDEVTLLFMKEGLLFRLTGRKLCARYQHTTQRSSWTCATSLSARYIAISRVSCITPARSKGSV